MQGSSAAFLSCLLLVCPALHAQTAPPASVVPQTAAPGTQGTATSLPATAPANAVTPAKVDVPANKDWTDTGIDLRRGDSIALTASGTVTLPPQGRSSVGKSVGPAGQPRGFRDLIKNYPLNTAGFGALIGRIGSSDAAEPFLIGASKEMQVVRAGRLFVGPNAGQNDSLTGSFQLTVSFTARGSETPIAPADLHLPEVTQ
jgi:hypothetical protein